MNVGRYLLRLYPRLWRKRYEEEFLVLLESRPLSFSDGIDILLGVLDAHIHPYFGACAMSLPERVIYMLYSLRRSLIIVFCAYIGFVVAGMGFQKMTEYSDFMDAARMHSSIGISYYTIIVGAVVALLAILVGGLPLAFAVVKETLSTKRVGRLLLLGVPFLALAVLFGMTGLVSHSVVSHLPRLFAGITFFGTFLLMAIVSTASVSVAVARSTISARLLRFAVLPSVIATAAMMLMLGATIFWGFSLQSEAPQLFAGNDGIMASSTSGTWLSIIVIMAISTLVAGVSLVRGISARLALQGIS